ncbi:MAG: hypothetical protein WB689_09750, partial [Xanthobacteraceae bacterium]
HRRIGGIYQFFQICRHVAPPMCQFHTPVCCANLMCQFNQEPIGMEIDVIPFVVQWIPTQ